MGEEKEFYKHLKPFLNCKDYTVSKEMYKVMLNEQYEMLVTTPVPADLENYYKVYDVFSFSKSGEELEEYIENR